MIDDLVRDIADFAQVGAHNLKERIWDAGFYSLVVQESHTPHETEVEIECRVQGKMEDLHAEIAEYLTKNGKTDLQEQFGYSFQSFGTMYEGVKVVITGVKHI